MNFAKPWILLVALGVGFAPAAAHAEDKKPDNTPPEGFVALFNGKDLTGWKGLVSPNGGPPALRRSNPGG